MFNYILIFLLLVINLTHGYKADKIDPTSISGIVEYKAQITLYRLKTYNPTLKFNQKKSIFRWNINNINYHNKDDAIRSKIIKKAYTDSIGRINLYNSEKDSLFSRKYLVDQVYILKEKNPQINWSITNTTKKIGNYICTKATTHFRGKDYTVWFTPKIPVPYGPWKLNGLPGLILKAYDTNRDIIFSAQKIEFSNTKNIGTLPLNGTEKFITLKKYKEIINHLRQRLAKSGLKAAREYMHQHKNITLEVKVPEIKLMETFEDSTDQ